jgi:hypothetical protein
MKTNNQNVDPVMASIDDPAAWIRLGVTLQTARRQFEREYVTAVLEKHHWRIPEAARALGIQRSNLYRTIRRLHLSRRSTAVAGGVSAALVLLDPGIAGTDPYDASPADRRRTRRLRQRAALGPNERFTSDTE